MQNNNWIWITWEKQRRSLVLSDEFHCKLFLYDKKHKYKISRYISASVKTLAFVKKYNPNVVFCQNPSIVLCCLMCVVKPLYGYKIVIDRHSNFMFNLNVYFRKKIFLILSNYTIKKADITVVTNDSLKNIYVNNIGGNGFTLPDKIPELSTVKEFNIDKNKKNVFFITSFSRDEPIEEFFNAISEIPDEYYFYVSGNYRKLKKNIEKIGKNYELTGYVEEDDFVAILNAVDAVMVLTKHEYTLTCGAYESVSVEKPMILSDTITIKEYFYKGAVYCNNTPEAIKEKIMKCFDEYDKLKKEVIELKKNLKRKWKIQFLNIKKEIDAFL